MNKNIQVDGDFGTFGDYKAIQFHFHLPSEHAIDSKLSAAEMHIVMARADGQLAVFGIMFALGDTNAFLDSIEWMNQPKVGEAPVAIKGKVNVFSAFKDILSGGYYRYMGSLTTPPCTEVVTWFVFEQMATISAAQVKVFQDQFPISKISGLGTNRPVQPLCGRCVVHGKYSHPPFSGE